VCFGLVLIINHSLEDDTALRAKVDEAMAVYDEYLKAQGDDEGEKPAAKEDKPEEKA
jgi:polyadenylate-binding protein